ncbi:MAG: DsbA family oxidoreductase [Candidatus Sericytochromatia bacterium]
MNNSNKKIKVEIWSDIACPFCYIGKRKFEEALNKFENKEDVQIEWKSFQLMPDAQKESDISLNEMLASRYGKSLDWAKEMNNNVSNSAKEVGLNFDLDNAKFTNTLDGHRLIHLASEFGLQDKAKEKLLSSYFIEGKHVGRKETLLEIAKELGIEESVVIEMLESDKYKKEVKEEIITGQKLGLTGVPFFVFNRKYAVAGAQPSETFLDILKQSSSDLVKV